MKRTEQKFTLIELLITVSILAILVAILLPGLNSARRKARTISCLSTQKQYACAIGIYTADNADYYFFGKSVPVDNAADAGQMQSAWLDHMLESGLLPYRKIEGYYRRIPVATCPEYENNMSGVSYGTTPYVLNSFRQYWADGLVTTLSVSPGIFAGCRTNQVKRPSALAIFGDRGLTQSSAASIPAIAAGESMVLQFDERDEAYGRYLRANAHGSGCNLAYADGHAGFIPYRSIRAGLFIRESTNTWILNYPIGGY